MNQTFFHAVPRKPTPKAAFWLAAVDSICGCKRSIGKGLQSTASSLVVILAFAAGAIAQPVLITAPQTLNPGATTIIPTAGGAPVPLGTAQITVRGTTLTVNGRHTIESLIVERNSSNQPGIVTHSPGFTFDYSGGNGTDLVTGLMLDVRGHVTVQGLEGSLVASMISASAKGYAATAGPGAGSSCNCSCGGGGGGHGGIGGVGINGALGGNSYGSYQSPTTFGSGGGQVACGCPGGAGGGTIRLVIGGILQCNGIIASNGGAGGCTFAGGGGGAGGSVWITAGVFSGVGQITVRGGNGGGNSSGGGGRLAIYSSGGLFSGELSASGWTPSTDTPRGQSGGAGSVYINDTATNDKTLTFDNGGRTDGITQLSSLGTFNGDLFITGGTKIRPATGSGTVDINVLGNMTVDAASQIDTAGRGYSANTGLGRGIGCECSCAGSGGGHGGKGGSTASTWYGAPGVRVGGDVYGDPTSPITAGSGGGSVNCGCFGGAGGGVIRVRVAGLLSCDGQLNADGLSGGCTFGGGGGGAGGSIWVTANAITGSGLYSARGGGVNNGDGGGAGGGGGRIAAYTCSGIGNISFNVQGGIGGPYNQGGFDGTTYLGTGSGLAISQQPEAATACVAQSVSFVLGVFDLTGTSFAWAKDGSLIDASSNPSATTPTLSLTNISPTDAGSYYCIITNACGSVTSNAADLNVDCNCQTNVTTTAIAGVPDAFSTDNGLEMGTPRPEFAAHLAQRLPGRDLLQFDSDSRNEVEYNRFVAHSFTGLPADITAATITTRVRAGGTNGADNEGTDKISIGHSFSATDFQGYKRFFGNENSPFLFNFPWRRYTASPQCDQTFTTPLDPAIITRMNTLGYLDFLVEDDSAVDYVTLQYTRAGPVPSGVNAAWIRSQPDSVGTACPGTDASFAVTAAGSGPFTYAWRKDSTPIDPLLNPSAATNTLNLPNITSADIASYDCIITNACGSVTSNPATLTICPGDFNCDGGIDGSDIESFFLDWEAGNAAADINEDGGIDGSDVEVFFGRWEAGC